MYCWLAATTVVEGVGSPKPQTLVDDHGLPKDTPIDSSTSSVFTLEPYSLPRDMPSSSMATIAPCSPTEKRKAKPSGNQDMKKKNAKLANLQNFNKIFGSPNWPRFFLMHLDKQDDFLIDEILITHGHKITLNKVSSGLRLIEVHTEEASNMLSSWVGNPPENMKVSLHENLNHTYGTIIVPEDIESEGVDFLNWGPKILNNLKLHNVSASKVDTFYAKSRRPSGPQLRIAKISFDSHTLPTEVCLAGRILKVKPYSGRPRQCNKCWRFGHPRKYCRSNTIYCLKCSKAGHESFHCTLSKIQCVNCGGDHRATSKLCPHFVFNNKVYQFQQKKGFPRRAAINYLRRVGEISKITYASRLNNTSEEKTQQRHPISSPKPQRTNSRRKTKNDDVIESSQLESLLNENRYQTLEDYCIEEIPSSPQLEEKDKTAKRRLSVSPTNNSDSRKLKKKLDLASPFPSDSEEMLEEESFYDLPSLGTPRLDLIVPASQIEVHAPQSPSKPVEQIPQAVALEDKPKNMTDKNMVKSTNKPSVSKITSGSLSKLQDEINKTMPSKSKLSNLDNQKPKDRGSSSKTKLAHQRVLKHLSNCSCVECISGTLREHSNTCGCPTCFLDACKQLTNKDTAAYRTCINKFINFKKCPLNHPHDDSKICAEYLKKNRGNIMEKANALIASILNPTGNLQKQIPTVNAPNPFNSYSRKKENAASAINIQNLKSLTS